MRFTKTFRARSVLWTAVALMSGFSGCSEGPQERVPFDMHARFSLGAEVCQADIQCSSGLYCLDGRCAFDCENDSECRSSDRCDVRGRCVPSQTDVYGVDDGTAGQDAVVGRVALAFDPTATPAFIQVAETEGVATISYSLSTVQGESGIPFRVELSRCNASSNRCAAAAYDRTVLLAPGSGSVEIPFSGLEANGDSLDVRLVSHGVDLRTTLVRHEGVQGHYEGSARVTQLGGAELPVGFELLVSPKTAALQHADAVQLVWRAGTGPLDVPVRDYPQGYRVDLAKQRINGKDVWWGVAQYEIELSDPAAISGVSDPRLFSGSGHRSVIRSLRVELDAASPNVAGLISDRFTGVVNLPSESGEVSRLVAVGSGAFSANLIGRSASESKAPTPPVPLSALQPVDITPRSCQSAMNLASGVDWSEICTTELPEVSQEEREACANVRSTAQFASLSVEMQRDCAAYLIACAEHEPSARTVFYDAWEADISGSSNAGAAFSSLLTECRASHSCEGESCELYNSCSTSPLVECAREATAFTLFHAPQSSYRSGELRSAFLDLSAELSFGEQLAAYAADTDLRLEWLKAQAAGDFSAAAVRDAAESNLEKWNVQVLNPVRKSLLRLIDVHAMSVLTSLSGDHDRDELEAWLVDLISLWSKTIFDVSYFTERWSFALDQSSKRRARYEYQQGLLSDFYVSAIVLSELLERVDASYLASMLTGISGLSSANQELLRTFEERVFDRDAELFEDRSLASMDTQLPEALVSLANRVSNDISVADARISQVVNTALHDAATDLEIRNRYESELQSLFSELRDVCSNPNNCSFADYLGGRCELPVDIERCGIADDALGTSANRARLAVDAALEDLLIAENDLLSQRAREDIQWQQFRQVQDRLGAMEDLHMLGYIATEEAVSELIALQEEGLARVRREADAAVGLRQTLAEAVSNAVDQRLQVRLDEQELTVDSFEHLQRIRRDAEQRQRAYIDEFERVSIDGIKSVMSSQSSALSIAESQLGVGVANILMNSFYDAAMTAIPTGATDVGAPSRAAFVIHKAAMNAQMHGAQGALSIQSQRILQQAENDRALASLELEVARLRDVSLPDLEDVRRVEEHRHALTLGMQTLGIDEQTILGGLERTREDFAFRQLVADQNSRIDEYELRARMERVELSNRAKQAELNYLQMRQEHAMRAEAALAQLHREMTYLSGLELRVERAQLSVLQSVNELYAVTNRAKTLQERFDFMNAQYQSVTGQRRSPTVFFMRANEVRRAERALGRARNSIMDLVVGAEYFAVLPFIQERILINSAYSISQLQRVHEDFSDRMSYCGGATGWSGERLSMRRDIYGIQGPMPDPVTGNMLSEKEQFHANLRQRNLAGYEKLLDAMRQAFGDVMTDLGRFYFLEFTIPVDGFSILSRSCNVRLEGLVVDFVGDLRAQQGFRPVIHIAMGDSGQMRSCHLNIDDIVAPYAHKTNFGRVTTFTGPLHVGTTLVGNDPTTGLNPNYVQAAGRPLASKYLLVIDKEDSSNQGIHWEGLEDVVINVSFSSRSFQVGYSRCAP